MKMNRMEVGHGNELSDSEVAMVVNKSTSSPWQREMFCCFTILYDEKINKK
jgi:hypothetical protein